MYVAQAAFFVNNLGQLPGVLDSPGAAYTGVSQLREINTLVDNGYE